MLPEEFLRLVRTLAGIGEGGEAGGGVAVVCELLWSSSSPSVVNAVLTKELSSGRFTLWNSGLGGIVVFIVWGFSVEETERGEQKDKNNVSTDIIEMILRSVQREISWRSRRRQG